MIIHNKKVIPQEAISKLIVLLNDHHNKITPFAFHQNNIQFLNKLRDIFKDIPEIYNLLKDDTYIAIRKVGASDSRVAFLPHFDNYTSTVLVPILVPNSDLNGDIIMWENARKTPSNIFSHLFVKLLFQNPISYYFLRKMFKENMFHQQKRFKRYSAKPGDFVHFNGFIHLHFNLNVDRDERMSLLIHNDKKFQDKFYEKFIVKMVEKYSRYRVK